MSIRFAFTILLATCLSTLSISTDAVSKTKLPYKKAGLSERQAAAHLLERFAFGARPGDVDRVVKIGLEKWLEGQLAGSLKDAGLDKRLEAFPSVGMSTLEILAKHPKNGLLRRQMQKDGIIDQGKTPPKEINEKMKAFRMRKGFRTNGELNNRDLPGQKLVRAVYSKNQLREVLTDFWFNHFNVTIRDGQAQQYVLPYERDAIRANALGNFRTLLGATAKHPAMLHYLDNTQSRAEEPPAPKLAQAPKEQEAAEEMAMGGDMAMAGDSKSSQPKAVPKAPPRKQKRGLNENYARELMELHTLGVDGGYTQKDVVEVARVLTGWGAMPNNRTNIEKAIKRNPQNFSHQGDFLFRRYWHDKREKTILGEKFPAGGGVEEGERVLDILVKHPSTAQFISTKLARRFITDKPSEKLVDRLAKTFQKSEGDLNAMMLAVAESPEFWEEATNRTKLKSPFELAVGSLRALDAKINNPRPVLNWVTRMGEPLYRYLPPTGFPDYADSWANTGTLVTRMNFGLFLTLGRNNGIQVDYSQGDVASSDAVFKTYTTRLLPEQDADKKLKHLTPMVDQEAGRKNAQIVGLILGSPEYQYH